MTVRDLVWDAALREVTERGVFRLSDLPFDREQRHTVRRALLEMEDQGWLTRGEKDYLWVAGDRAQELLNLTTIASQRATRRV